jgi:hypothetical protein
MIRWFQLCVNGILCVALAGCSGTLKVFDENQKEIAGMPFKTAEVFVRQGTYTKLAKGGDCTLSPFIDTVSLPTGAQYFVMATSSSFAKTAFHIKYNDAGAVAEVGLDSEPAGAENIKAASELIKTVAPILGIGAVVAAAAPAVRAGPNACDVGEANVSFTKLEEYVKVHKRP